MNVVDRARFTLPSISLHLWYVFALKAENGDSCALQVGPIIAGPMAAHVGWRNFWWLYAALLAFTIIVTIFGFPETRWERNETFVLPGAEHNKVMGHSGTGTDGSHSPPPDEKHSDNNMERTVTADDPYLRKGGPSRSQFLPFQKPRNLFRTLVIALYLPWLLLLYPIVEFAAFVVSWTASMFLMTNITQSQAFAAPPWNFSSQTIGQYSPSISRTMN